MPRTRLWIGNDQYGAGGTTGSFSAPGNWRSISVRNPTYRWTAYGGGTAGSYYLELAGGGDPSIAQPDGVEYYGTALTYQADRTTLTANKWGYGSVGGFSTVIIHVGGGDPDAADVDAVGLIDLPDAGDTLLLSAESEDDMATNLDRSATTYAALKVIEGCAVAVGSATHPLRLTLSGSVQWHNRKVGYLDLRASAIDVEVEQTAGAGAGGRGLWLIGSALGTLDIHGGQVGVGWTAGQTASVDVARVMGSASVWIADGVTLSEYRQTGGSDCRVLCACDDVQVYGGRLTIDGSGVIASATVKGGIVLLQTTGDVTALVIDDGVVDTTGCAHEREITSCTHNGGELRVDPSVVSIPTYVLPTRPSVIAVRAAS